MPDTRPQRSAGSLVIVTPFYDGVGGVAVAVRQLAAQFRERGRDVAILTRGASATVVPDANETGVYRLLLRVPSPTVRSWIAFLLYAPVILVRLRRFLAARRADTVLIQFAVPWHFYFGLLRPGAPWRLFITFQGDDAHNAGGYTGLYRLLFRLLLRSADGVTGVSTSLVRKVRAAVPSATANAIVIPNGAPTQAAGNGAAEEDYAITVGLLQYRKGIDVLIRALGVLKHRGVRLRMLIVGPGEELESLQALARREAVDDQVVFAGGKSHGEVLDLMRRSRFFVLASRAEGLPLVVVEAMMCGRPVVATNIDGVPEIVTHEVNGLLVEPEQEVQLADALQRMDADPALRARYGAAARRVAERFEWGHVAAQYLEFLDASPGRVANGTSGSATP